MSVYVVTNEHIDYLISAALRFSTGAGSLYWAMPHDPGTRAALPIEQVRECTPETAEAVGQLLLSVNQESVNHKYGEDDLEPVYTFSRKHDVSAVQTLKLLQSYEYQATCHREVWEASNARGFCERLRLAATERLAGYRDAEWAI